MDSTPDAEGTGPGTGAGTSTGPSTGGTYMLQQVAGITVLQRLDCGPCIVLQRLDCGPCIQERGIRGA